MLKKEDKREQGELKMKKSMRHHHLPFYQHPPAWLSQIGAFGGSKVALRFFDAGVAISTWRTVREGGAEEEEEEEREEEIEKGGQEGTECSFTGFAVAFFWTPVLVYQSTGAGSREFEPDFSWIGPVSLLHMLAPLRLAAHRCVRRHSR